MHLVESFSVLLVTEVEQSRLPLVTGKCNICIYLGYPIQEEVCRVLRSCVSAVCGAIVQASACSLYGMGLELDNFQGPFQPKPFYDSMCMRQLLSLMAVKQ